MTLVPLHLVRPVGFGDVATNALGLVALANNPEDPHNETLAQRLTLQSMPGVRAEVLVAHEMGHQLFLPHAPAGFNRKDIDESAVELGFIQKKVLSQFISALDKTPALLDKVNDATKPAGASNELHVSDHGACMMGYNFAALASMHFCVKCILRMRGWRNDAIEALKC
jgi:hypothetical protein